MGRWQRMAHGTTRQPETVAEEARRLGISVSTLRARRKRDLEAKKDRELQLKVHRAALGGKDN